MVIKEKVNQRDTRVIRDGAFAKRLEIACEGNPHCPTELYRGKQKWIYDGLEKEFGLKVSSEAVRKWFAGESRPRPKVMSYIARLLEVDEAWLSLGITPDLTPVEKKKRNALADGAVNLVAGIIQMGGGNIAFPDDDSAHIYAIIAGKQVSIDVVLPLEIERDHLRMTVSDNLDRNHVIAVIENEDFSYKLLNLPADVIRDAGALKGDYWEVVVERRGTKFKAGQHQIKELASVRELVRRT